MAGETLRVRVPDSKDYVTKHECREGGWQLFSLALPPPLADKEAEAQSGEVCGPRSPSPLLGRAGTRGSPGLQSASCKPQPIGANSSRGSIYTVLSTMRGWTRDGPKEEQPGKEAWQLPGMSACWAGPGGSVLWSARDRGLRGLVLGTLGPSLLGAVGVVVGRGARGPSADTTSPLQVYRSKMDGEATSPLPRTRSGPLPSSSGSSSSSSQLSVATLGRSPSPKV